MNLKYSVVRNTQDNFIKSKNVWRPAKWALVSFYYIYIYIYIHRIIYAIYRRTKFSEIQPNQWIPNLCVRI
jgi:hypothetical protein